MRFIHISLIHLYLYCIMHENQKWVFQQCVKAYFFRKFADPRGGGMGVPPPSFQLKKQ